MIKTWLTPGSFVFIEFKKQRQKKKKKEKKNETKQNIETNLEKVRVPLANFKSRHNPDEVKLGWIGQGSRLVFKGY